MDENTSIALTVDVEPDERTFDPSTRPRWIGFETLLPEMRRLRKRLAKATGVAVHFTWLFRIDQQIQRTYGSPDWPFVQYRSEVDELCAAGDEIGVHTHAWRWDDGASDWIADHGNPEWVGRCIDESLATFRNAFGRPARVFRFGDRFLSNEVIAQLDRAGVHCDLTLEPGCQPSAQIRASERATGSLPDFTAAPRIPYRPSPQDFLQPGLALRRRLWLMPTTTGILPNPLTGSDAPAVLSRLLGPPCSIMRQVFEGYLSSAPLPLVVSVARSDVLLDAFNSEQFREFCDYLADRARNGSFVFETPIEAIKRYRRMLATHRYGRRELARRALATRFPERASEAPRAAIHTATAKSAVVESNDANSLARELQAERGFNRALTAAVQRLRVRLAAIEGSRLWKWGRRWRRLRSLLGRLFSGQGSGLFRHLLGAATREGRRRLRRAAKVACRKTYLWLEDEPVDID